MLQCCQGASTLNLHSVLEISVLWHMFPHWLTCCLLCLSIMLLAELFCALHKIAIVLLAMGGCGGWWHSPLYTKTVNFCQSLMLFHWGFSQHACTWHSRTHLLLIDWKPTRTHLKLALLFALGPRLVIPRPHVPLLQHHDHFTIEILRLLTSANAFSWLRRYKYCAGIVLQVVLARCMRYTCCTNATHLAQTIMLPK